MPTNKVDEGMSSSDLGMSENQAKKKGEEEKTSDYLIITLRGWKEEGLSPTLLTFRKEKRTMGRPKFKSQHFIAVRDAKELRKEVK